MKKKNVSKPSHHQKVPLSKALKTSFEHCTTTCKVSLTVYRKSTKHTLYVFISSSVSNKQTTQSQSQSHAANQTFCRDDISFVFALKVRNWT